ncbi:nuclear transport factor 2 family protein [Streptomyces sp. 2RAF24]|uniref:nuclear transport factor 2 family protein n=1 Tax=Streptomyces sp. 2RAF24 TaxID=3232997 RepID=UPI003F9CC86F
MTRSPQETCRDHVRALDSGDRDAIAANFTPDAVFVTPDCDLRGRDGVKQGIGAALARVEDGVDTFVFRDGHPRARRSATPCRPGLRPDGTRLGGLTARSPCDRDASSSATLPERAPGAARVRENRPPSHTRRPRRSRTGPSPCARRPPLSWRPRC